MSEFVNDTLIIVPVFTKEHDQDLVEKIRGLVEVGSVYVVEQGKKLKFGELPKQEGKFDQIKVKHVYEAVGIWGALHVAYQEITGLGGGVCDHPFFQQLPEYVLLNLAPKLFIKDILAGLVSFTKTSPLLKFDHLIGVRTDIAASLGSKQRAYLECFFSTLAGIVSGNGRAFSRDGFTGLHLLSCDRYFNSDWEWILAQNSKQPWGGALITQIQSFLHNALTGEILINTDDARRNWPSTLGEDERKAVFTMLDKCRQLPMFAKVSKAYVKEALRLFYPDFYEQFRRDDKEPVIEEVRSLLKVYNEQSADGPFLKV